MKTSESNRGFNRYACQRAEADHHGIFNPVKECLEQFKSYEQEDLQDEGDDNKEIL